MVETVIGQKYRDRIKGLVGTATAKMVDPEGVHAPDGRVLPPGIFNPVSLTQLQLDKAHLGDMEDASPKGHDMTWYADDRLENIPEPKPKRVRSKGGK